MNYMLLFKVQIKVTSLIKFLNNAWDSKKMDRDNKRNKV